MSTSKELPIVQTFLGLPRPLLAGYIAIALFMTGDGFELAFLSQYITTLGYSKSEASLVFTVYGLAAAISAWSSGVIAELITVRRAMRIGAILWVAFHVCFLYFGLAEAHYGLIILFYGLRGLAYPLFLYSFVVAIVQNVNPRQVSPALGWFWTVYSIGIGVVGSFIPSITIPMIGEYGTLWLALIFAVSGAGTAIFGLQHLRNSDKSKLSAKEKFGELLFAVKLFRNPHITYAAIIRVINTLSLFGFAVIMPMMFVDELGWTIDRWLLIWTVFFAVTIFSNVFWGIMNEIMGWINVIRYMGCLGMAFSTLSFYFIPHAFPDSFFMSCIPAVLLGWFVGAFVAVTPIMTTLEPEHKGAAISVYNLSAGASNFAAPAIAVLILPHFGVQGVVYTYAALYILAFVLTFLLKVKQPGFNGAFKPRTPMDAEADAEVTYSPDTEQVSVGSGAAATATITAQK